MSSVVKIVDSLLVIGGRSRQVARTLCIVFLCLIIANKVKQKYLKNGLRHSLMQFAFIIYTKYKGKSGVKSMVNDIQENLEESLIPSITKTYEKNLVFPSKSIPKEQLISMLTNWSKYENKLWNGETHFETGTVYHGEESLTKIQNEAYNLFSLSNPLHPTTFPFIRKMESEIIAMTLTLFNGHINNGHCGSLTSGGTESIILAIRAYKNYAKVHKKIKYPQLIIPTTAHAAFDKACDLMNIEVIKVDVELDSYTVLASKMEQYITSDTIAIVGSTPQYAHGTMDCIKDLSNLALKYNIGLHVDCCLGSFMLPILSNIGYKIEPFDFRLKGVTSISCDTHKYGFASKGTSVLMFKNKSYRKHTYFCYGDCPMGLYATPTILGSRNGGIIASTWVTIMYFGLTGYEKAMKTIMNTVDFIKNEIRNNIKEIELMGEPVMSVIAFKERENYKNLDIFKLSDAMSNKGWSFAKCQKPKCIHFAFTIANCKNGEKFVNDLKESIIEVIQYPQKFKEGSGAMYGTVIDIPCNGFKNDINSLYLDVVYGVF